MTAVSLPFAAGLVLDWAPMESRFWWDYARVFCQDAGAIALLGLWLWVIVTFVRSFVPSSGNRRGLPVYVLVMAAIAAIATTLYGAGAIGSLLVTQNQTQSAVVGMEPPTDDASLRRWSVVMAIGGFIALLGVFVPFLRDSVHLKFRRIWALTKLSFLESLRRRVLWVFLILLLPALFPPWWFLKIKPEEQVSINVKVAFFGANAVLLLAAAALAAFSIPSDIRNQTIHTIVTKPVEKFEIIVGRFLGYLGLTTGVLIVAFGFSYLMIALSADRLDPGAVQESMRARVPIFGYLGFSGPSKDFQGESVGREWEYRRYIPGGVASPYRAVWYFTDRTLDRSLQDQDVVNCEFSFDIFRTTKGQENKPVVCTFFVITNAANKDLEVARTYQQRTQGLSLTASPDGTESEQRDWKEIEKIAGELGYFEFRNKPVVDYQTDSIPIPTSLIRKAFEEGNAKVGDKTGTGETARFIVAVRCDSPTQFLGVARNDLYLLAKERSFFFNYFKGAIGLWLRLVIVIGIAVTCSTYLNGVVSLLVTGMLVFLGFFIPEITAMSLSFASDVPNPGPADSFRKLISNESLGTAPDATNVAHQVSSAADEVFRWGLRRVISTFPQMYRLTWQDYVAAGFDVPFEDLLWNGLGVLGYLSLWAVLGHYLINWREIATW